MTMQTLDLPTLGRRLKLVDRMLVQLLAARNKLSLEVGASKIENNGAIFRPEIEEARISEACDYGELFGLRRGYVASIMYAMIRESCMDQLVQRETNLSDKRHAISYEEQKRNLLALTEAVAPSYDSEYASAHSTRVYLAFEDAVLEEHINDMDRERRGIFLDLGCGTGNIALRATQLFRKVVGYDLSAHMTTVAWEKYDKRKPFNTDVSFLQADLEDGIDQPNASVSFVAMSLGTASELRNIELLISETMRVLEPGGRFLFSFHNKEALLSQWEYLPWQIALNARINRDFHCLDVEARGKVYEVYARPYTVSEVRAMFPDIGHLAIRTYPTLNSVLPGEAFTGENTAHIDQIITALDRQLMFGGSGAYIVVTGVK